MGELAISILQGVVIAFFVLLMYQYGLKLQYNESTVRSLVFSTMVFSNLFLTLANRSFYYNFWVSFGYKNRAIPLILAVSILMLLAIIYIAPIAQVFQMESLTIKDMSLCFAAGFASILWFELYKSLKKLN
jgi:Ca2+-transporting ATPase